MSMHPSERLLPAPEEIELADYLMGSYLSALEAITARVKRETEPISVEEYLRMRDAGLADAAGSDFEESDLLELVRFTADALHDAESIRVQAAELQATVLGCLHDQRNPSGHDDPAWLAYRGRIRAFHQAQLGDDAGAE